MKKSEDKLERLLALARQAPTPATPTVAPHWQTRVLADRRPANLHAELWGFLHAKVRGGFVFAAVLMLACILWALNTPVQETENDFDLASFELRVDGL
jgi:type VI protein secretion system component VasF